MIFKLHMKNVYSNTEMKYLEVLIQRSLLSLILKKEQAENKLQCFLLTVFCLVTFQIH